MNPLKNLKLAHKFYWGVGLIMLVTFFTAFHVISSLDSVQEYNLKREVLIKNLVTSAPKGGDELKQNIKELRDLNILNEQAVDSGKILFYRLLLIILILVFLVCYFIIASVVGPAKKLMDKTKDIASGNLGTPVTIDSKDEFGELAEAFNDMAAKLKESMESLVEQSQDLAADKLKEEAIIDSFSDGIVVTDDFGNIIMMNMAAEKLLGSRTSTVRGKPLTKLLPQKQNNEKEEPLILALADGSKQQALYEITGTSGKSTSVDITFSPFIYNEKIVGAVAVMHEVFSLT